MRLLSSVSGARVRTVAAVAVALTALAACKSSSDSAAGSARAYKLAVFGEFSAGPGAQIPVPYPQIAAGVQAAAREINARGGVNGQQINVSVCDTKGSPNGATVCANQAVRDKVLAVVAPLDLTGTYMSVLEAAAIPAIGPYAVAQTLINPYSYPLYGGSATNLAGSVSLLARKGAKSVSIVADASAGLAALSALLKPVQNHFPGLQISLDPIAATTVDLAPIVAQANRSDGIVLATNNPTSAVSFLNAQKQSGVTKPISSSTTQITPKLLGQAAPLIASMGVYVSSAFLPATYTDNKAVAAFNAAMDAEDKSAAKDDFSSNGYASVELFAKLITGKTDVTSASLIADLKSVQDLDLGLLAPLQFTTPSEDAPNLPRLFNPNVVVLKVSGSKLVPVDGTFVNAYRQQ